MSSLVTVACAQLDPVLGDRDANLAALDGAIAAAVERGADLVVAPELCLSGYVFESREEAYAHGESPDALVELARAHEVHLVAGFAERDGVRLYNSAAICAPDGLLGVYRKLHLWGEEALWFEPGDLGLPVFATPFGRIAAMVCYDGWFAELWRMAALGGADLVCVPTNWVPIPGQAEGQAAMANTLCMAAAHSNGLWVAAADRVGEERGQPFIGQSLIVAPTGWPVAGPASEDAVETLVAQIDLSAARRSRTFNTFNHLLRDRRTDAYDLR